MRMVQRLVDDIRAALDNDLYFVALSTALTLPDICGKAAYPRLSTTNRYKKWYNKEIGRYEKNPHQASKEEMPYLSSEVIYSLRCSLLHEGNPNLNNPKLTNKNASLPIDHFVLKTEKKNEFDIYSDSSSVSDFGQYKREYTMSIRRICLIICCVAEDYYKDNKEKFHFNYEILDWDKATENLPPIDMDAVMEALADPNLGNT